MRLAELGAYIETGHRLAGIEHSILFFTIRGSFYAMRYNDVGADVTNEHGRVLVWRRESGSTIDDLTLSPSYLVYETDPATGARVGERLHGWVRDGAWIDC